MTIIIYIGAALALVGIVGLGFCVSQAFRIRKESNEEVANRKLQKLVGYNFGALAIASLGLIMIIMGMVL